MATVAAWVSICRAMEAQPGRLAACFPRETNRTWAMTERELPIFPGSIFPTRAEAASSPFKNQPTEPTGASRLWPCVSMAPLPLTPGLQWILTCAATGSIVYTCPGSWNWLTVTPRFWSRIPTTAVLLGHKPMSIQCRNIPKTDTLHAHGGRQRRHRLRKLDALPGNKAGTGAVIAPPPA